MTGYQPIRDQYFLIRSVPGHDTDTGTYLQVTSWEEFGTLVLTPLLRLGPYLAQNPILFTKVLRMFNFYIAEHSEDLLTDAMVG